MGVVNFGVKKYASLEINRAAFRKNGEIVSQIPLGTAFTAAAPCENGMWVDANSANDAITAPAAGTKVLGIVCTAEKVYNDGVYGLHTFCEVGGDYPRVGIFHEGDVFTTNCFKYDNATWANDAAVLVSANGSTPLYVKATTGDGRPTLTASAPATGLYGQVVGSATMPNGEKAIKYTLMHA